MQAPDGSRLTILRKFEFDQTRATSSVIVRDANGNVRVFCKGSPEAIATRCKSAPHDLEATVSSHALQGCYVLSVGERALGQISIADIQQLNRDDVEIDLELMGLMLFRNELKSDTASAIARLKTGHVRCVMITGSQLLQHIAAPQKCRLSCRRQCPLWLLHRSASRPRRRKLRRLPWG